MKVCVDGRNKWEIAVERDIASFTNVVDESGAYISDVDA